MSQKSNNVSLLGGILIGSAIGTIVGLLSAPRKGKETREIIKKTASAFPEMAEDISSTVQLNSQRITTITQQNWQNTVKKVKKAIAVGIEASKTVNN